MTKTMKEFFAAKMLTAVIKKVMGEQWNQHKTCAGNVAALVRKCAELEKEVESDFKSPANFYKEQNMASGSTKSNAKRKPRQAAAKPNLKRTRKNSTKKA